MEPYLMDRENMADTIPVSNNVLQKTIDLGINAHLHSSFAYYKGSQKEYIYSWVKILYWKHFLTAELSTTWWSQPKVRSQGYGAFLKRPPEWLGSGLTGCFMDSAAANGDANQSVESGVILYAIDATM